MRVEASITSISWIPSEAVTGAFKLPFSMGVAHYDHPPADDLGDIEAMVNEDRCRFCNQLSAYIDVEDDRITGYGFVGNGVVGSTTLRIGPASMTFAPVVFPTLRAEPSVSASSVKFTQTCGARTGVPAPRPVKRPPFFQLVAPTAWTTLELELFADGSCAGQLAGASPFPRHWIYDNDGKLFQKSSLISFKKWSDEHFGGNTPWGNADSPALVSAVESALERQLSLHIMRAGDAPHVRTVPAGRALCVQGELGDELYLLLDGLLDVWANDELVATLGPGVVLGERALLEGGRRTSTLRAQTDCRVACAPGDKVDRAKLEELATGHRRELA